LYPAAMLAGRCRLVSDLALLDCWSPGMAMRQKVHLGLSFLDELPWYGEQTRRDTVPRTRDAKVVYWGEVTVAGPASCRRRVRLSRESW
jgi:hypothetical protein